MAMYLDGQRMNGIGSPYTDLIDTLETGETTLTIQDSCITTSSTLDIYTDTYGVTPTNVSVSTGSITLTFDTQASDVSVKVRVWIAPTQAEGSYF